MVQLLLDNSKSRSGKHVMRTVLFKIDGVIEEVTSTGIEVTPTYKVGKAFMVDLPSKGIFVYVILIRNVYNRVRGKILVIKDGNPVLVLNYRKLKIKRVNGDPSFYEYVKKVIEQTKIPVKRVNLK
ncbi:MAG: hypothetical protein MPF33_06890 [Candidatus Aramenus sp.]|nr:hypothetical protein [Candidatus Aramenus sp.]